MGITCVFACVCASTAGSFGGGGGGGFGMGIAGSGFGLQGDALLGDRRSQVGTCF